MRDYHNYKVKNETSKYSQLDMIKDGLGVMVVAILGYIIACGAFILWKKIIMSNEINGFYLLI